MDDGDRSSALQQALRRLVMVAEGVKTCVLVNEDGFPLAAYGDDNESDPLDPAEVAAISTSLFHLAERSLDRLAQGDIGRLLLESESGTLLSCPAGPATLTLLVDPAASLGHVLYAAQKAATEIENILTSVTAPAQEN